MVSGRLSGIFPTTAASSDRCPPVLACVRKSLYCVCHGRAIGADKAMVNAIQGSNLKQALSVALPQLAPWRPAAVALMAPDRPSLSFAGLANLVDKLCGDLARR